MKGRVRRQASFLDQPIYDALIPPKHFLSLLASILDWQALAAGLDDCYADDGRPSWPPEQMLKITVLQFLYDRSDREIAEDLRLNIGYKFFLGMSREARLLLTRCPAPTAWSSGWARAWSRAPIPTPASVTRAGPSHSSAIRRIWRRTSIRESWWPW